jgi:endoglucanase
MRTNRAFALALLFLALTPVCRAETTNFLHTHGEDIVDDQGQKFLPRGLGLGNWTLPEGYMWRFGKEGDRPRRIEKIVSDLIGPGPAAQFWTEYRRQYITEDDISRLAELGFNIVRPSLNFRLFMTEGDNPAPVAEGFDLLDYLIGWCRKNGVYVIIDMHAAPGGQTGQNIDDSANDQPELFMDKRNQDRLVDLWVKIATRYKNEPAVAAYDLLNEPLPQRTGAAAKYKAQLEPLYKRVTQAIRKVDRRHMITVEGADWANDWSVFSKPFDKNLLYQFHYYCWDRPANLKGINQYLARRTEWQAPIFAGETGESDNRIYWGTTDFFEANNIGWSFWPWKKMQTINTPYSITPPEGWDAIVAYSRGEDEKPTPEQAQKAFDGLLRNIQLSNCVFQPNVVNALFHRMPAKIQAENYGHEGPGKSYFVKDTAQKAEFYRKSEPVPIVTTGGGGRGGLAIRLGEGEWTAYTANSPQAGTYEAVARVKMETTPATLGFSAGGQLQEVAVTNGDWAEIKLNAVTLPSGANRLQLKADHGTLLIDWISLR